MPIYVDPTGAAGSDLPPRRDLTLRSPTGTDLVPSTPQRPTINMGTVDEIRPPVAGSLRGIAGMVGRAGGALATAGALGNQFEDDSTKRYAQRFGVTEPTGDGSVGDIAKFAALRAGGFASDLGNNLTMGLAGNLFRDKDTPRPVSPNVDPNATAIAPDPAGGPPIPTGPVTDPMSLRTAATPPAVASGPLDTRSYPPQSTNVVNRDGNSFSGNTVTEGFQYQNPDGSRLTPTPRVTTLGSSADVQAINDRTRAIDAQNANLRSQLDAYGPGPHGGGIGGFGPATLSSTANDRFNSTPSASITGHGYGGYGGGGRGAREERMQANRLATEAGIAHLRESGEFARAGLRENTALTMNERNVGATERGQDVQREGHYLASQTARMQGRLQQMQQDRQYQLDVSKFGREKANDLFNQRETGQKSFNDWAETALTTTDEKGRAIPDKAKIADFTQAATQTLGNVITRLQQAGDPDSLKKAEMLSQKGLGALDAEDRAELATLYARRERFAQTRGTGVFSGGGPTSNDLFDYRITGNDNGLVQRRFKLAGGQTIGENDLKYDQPANTVLPDWFKTPTTSLGPTLREQRGMK